MVFYNFDHTFYINSLNTILMNRNDKYDVCLAEYVMASGYAIKDECLRFQQFPNVRKRNIMWTLP